MNVFEIVIDNKKYEYVTSKKINNKNYIAYADDNNIFISEYLLNNNKLELLEISDEIFNMVKEVMNIE